MQLSSYKQKTSHGVYVALLAQNGLLCTTNYHLTSFLVALAKGLKGLHR